MEPGKRHPQSFYTIESWCAARILTKRVYRASATFPKDELYGMTSQIRRAMVSVMSNIAEGARREYERDYAHFLNMSEGSMAEVMNLLLLAQDLEYLTETQAQPLIKEADRVLSMIYGLRMSVEGRQPPEGA